MARSYDGAGNTSAREQVEHDKQLEKARNQKIELGVIIGAIAIAGISIFVNVSKCVSAVSATKNYNTQRVEAETNLEQLNMKLQDPAAQNYVYEDPTIGNMTETGQNIAMMQNQIISANQSYSGLSFNTSTNSGMHVQTTSQTGGAVTLDPNDLAPSGAETPESEAVEENEATITPDNSSDETDSGYTYTPITNFDNVPVMDTQTDTSVSDMTTDEPGVVVDTPTVVSDGRDLAQLISDFKKNYFAQQIANVDNVPGTEYTAWSWYGSWEFSGTYDYSVNEVSQMKAVWTCYEPSDVRHLKPLAFVTAVYTESTKRFTNPTAYYTQYYVKASEGQKNAFGNQQQNNYQQDDNFDNALLIPDSPVMNGEGSENEYQLTITEDDENNVTDNSDGEAITLTPDEGDSTNQNPTNNQPIDTTQPDNPSGAAPWTPGGGANPGSGNDNPGGTGTWNPNGTTNQENSNNTGTWTPAN